MSSGVGDCCKLLLVVGAVPTTVPSSDVGTMVAPLRSVTKRPFASVSGFSVTNRCEGGTTTLPVCAVFVLDGVGVGAGVGHASTVDSAVVAQESAESTQASSHLKWRELAQNKRLAHQRHSRDGCNAVSTHCPHGPQLEQGASGGGVGSGVGGTGVGDGVGSGDGAGLRQG